MHVHVPVVSFNGDLMINTLTTTFNHSLVYITKLVLLISTSFPKVSSLNEFHLAIASTRKKQSFVQ